MWRKNLPENAKNRTAKTVVNGQEYRSFTVRKSETNEVADDGGMSEAYLLDKLAEAKDAAGLTQL